MAAARAAEQRRTVLANVFKVFITAIIGIYIQIMASMDQFLFMRYRFCVFLYDICIFNRKR